MATIVIHRPHAFPDALLVYRVFVDGVEAAALKRQESCSVHVQAGTHDVVAKSDALNFSAPLRVDVSEEVPCHIEVGSLVRRHWWMGALAPILGIFFWLRKPMLYLERCSEQTHT